MSCFELVSVDVQVSLCFLSICLVVKLFSDGDLVLVKITKKETRREKQQDEETEKIVKKRRKKQRNKETKQIVKIRRKKQQDEETEQIVKIRRKKQQDEQIEQIVKISNNFIFLVSDRPLERGIEEKFGQFRKLIKKRKQKTDLIP